MGSARESVKTCILRGFLGGAYFRSAGRPNNTFSPEWPINRGLAVEMALRGRNDGTSTTTVLPALGAWKPAKDAGFHIPTATATAAVKLDATAKTAQIERFYRFSSRTVLSLVVRIAWLTAKPMVIGTEGAFYARVAENFATGKGLI